jgi:hypothetical protein
LLGIQHAHGVGIIHRDIKPDNIVRIENPDGTWLIKVVDFGIAKLAARESSNEPLTKAGVVFGTPQYMAPEQALGTNVTEQADLYAVGVILWRMLTGRPLFEAEDHMEVLSLKLVQAAPTLSKIAPGVFSPALEDLLRHVLERKPADRLKTAEEMLEAIQSIKTDPGGGLAMVVPAGAGQLWGARLARLPHHTVDLFTQWYCCPGSHPGPPNWPRRLRALRDTRQGRLILAILIMTILLLVGVPLVLFKGAPPPSPINTAPLAMEQTKPAIAPQTGGSAAGSKKSGPSISPQRLKDPLSRARLFLAQGACREASLELMNLSRQDPGKAQVHYLLGASLMCRKYYSEGMEAYARAIALDGNYRHDARILEDLEQLFKVSKIRDAALAFLRDKMGQAALPLLIKAASTHSQLKVRQDAAAAVQQLGAAAQIDWVSKLSLDLHQLSSCKDRAGVVAKLRAMKDRRAIPILRQARDERAGFWGRSYRNWCIRAQIVDALKELQSLDPEEQKKGDKK